MKMPRRGGALRPLMILAALCVTSAGLRIADGSGAAIAREVSALNPYAPLVQATESDAPDSQTTAILEALRAREEQLDRREAELAALRVSLTEAEARIASQLADLAQAESSLRAALDLAEGAAAADVDRLTQMYERMKPKEAAILFETMAPDFAAGFLGRMNPEAAAAILAGLSPDVAYSLSAILAGRHVGVPKE